MIPWYVRDSPRLLRELEETDRLTAAAEWLTAVEWKFVSGGLQLLATLTVHGHAYVIQLLLPDLFPSVPIVARPVGETARLSGHQYGGADGVLCLEWGPDNWHEGVSAADMITSAFRLFSVEDPKGNPTESLGRAASRHELTLGQRVRSEWLRFFSTRQLRSTLTAAPLASGGRTRFSLRKRGSSMVAMIHELETSLGKTKIDEIPEFVDTSETDLLEGIWSKLSIPKARLIQVASASDINDLVADYIAAGERGLRLPERKLSSAVIVDADGDEHYILTRSDGSISRAVVLGSEREIREISDTRRVAIVGLGAMGSKVAASLARDGVRNFVLVDADLFLPENVARHLLDWDSVGLQKVEAVSAALRRIDARVTVATHDVLTTGQESSGVVNALLTRIAECDVIVDATADPGVFTQLSAVAVASETSLVWAEVFGGGVGGFVARSRVGHDPKPLEMRQAYLSFCDTYPAPPELVMARKYTTETPDGQVEARDSDVAIIAHHAARFVTDGAAGEPSAFPSSFYLIGLAKAWVFESPFDTIPISMANYPTWTPAAVDGLAGSDALLDKIAREPA